MLRSGEPDLALRARRQILDLKPGTQIPGKFFRYTGHRPGVRFGIGNTYGRITHILNLHKGEIDLNKQQHALCFMETRRRYLIPDPKNDSSAVGELLLGGPAPYTEIYRETKRPVDFDRVPPSGVKPGYTGFVPLLRQQLGGSYSNSAKMALEEFDEIRRQKASVLNGAQSLPRLVPVADDDLVRERMQLFKASRLKDTRREYDEPPIVGYQGHIPRLRPTSCNVGVPFQKAARDGLSCCLQRRPVNPSSPVRDI